MNEKSTYYLETLTPDQLGELLFDEVQKDSPDVMYIQNIIVVGCPIDIIDVHNWTPLQHAARHGHLEVVEFLESRGADIHIHAMSKLRLSAFRLALDYKKFEIAKFLISRGVDINQMDENGWSELYRSSAYGNLDTVKFLISNGVDMYAKNKWNTTPLHVACFHGQQDVIKFLVSMGCYINDTDIYGESPLHNAIQKENFDIIKFLISNGVDIHVKDDKGRTAWDRASYESKNAFPELEPK